jgi:GWxTD domain-containing protein
MMRKLIYSAAAVILAAAVIHAAPAAKKIAVLDFAAYGKVPAENGVDVADNVRLMFHSAEGYKVEPYRRTANAVSAARDAGLDLTALKDISRLGKALGDELVVTGSVTYENDKYTVQLWINDIGANKVAAAYDGEGADLRSLTEELIRGISGAERFGVLFPDKVKDLPRPTEQETRRALALIASDEELALFDLLSPRGASMMLDKFWVRRDPTPDTPENEYYDEFWRRVDYVQTHYSDPIREGLQTDRGKVYVLYGRADDIEDHTAGQALTSIEMSTWDTKSYEAWKYYFGGTGGRRMLFIFVDDVGDGVYNIFASTEPGFGRHISSFAEFDMNRLAIDAEDWGDEAETNPWDFPGRHENR